MFMAKHRKLISCSYVNDMKYWNNLEIYEFQPKGNDDMMQCIKTKTLKNKETTNITVEQDFKKKNCWSERH